jgi:hypothetical protein
VVDTDPETTLVVTANVTLFDPAGTVTLRGTDTGSLPDNDTSAPPAGAAALRVAVPFTNSPPTTLDMSSEIDESTTAALAVTVSVA